MATYTGANGETFSDEDIEKWCEAYDKEELPEGYEFGDTIYYGLPPQLQDKQETVSFKLPAALKQKLVKAAKDANTSTSAYIKALILEKIAML